MPATVGPMETNSEPDRHGIFGLTEQQTAWVDIGMEVLSIAIPALLAVAFPGIGLFPGILISMALGLAFECMKSVLTGKTMTVEDVLTTLLLSALGSILGKKVIGPLLTRFGKVSIVSKVIDRVEEPLQKSNPWLIKVLEWGVESFKHAVYKPLEAAIRSVLDGLRK